MLLSGSQLLYHMYGHSMATNEPLNYEKHTFSIFNCFDFKTIEI